MFYKTTLLASLLILFSNLLPAQDFLDIDIKNKCVYSGNHMDEELYSFPTDVTVMENLVKQILELGGDLTANFQVIQTNVENVSAVVDDNKRYLLWSQDFLAGANRIEAWGSTAHEIAHHINKHSLSPGLAKIEETEADFFMGFIFFKANFSKEQIMVFVQRMPLSGYAGSKRQRLENIMNGYKKGESGSKFKSLQYENDPSLINFMNAQFPFPPPECHTAYEIPNNYFSTCFDLGAVSKKITLGLESKQYPYKYMSVPNGFAIVTQMEQYNKDGSLMSGSAYRWVDYPVQESFSLSWNYIKSLIYPKKGYLRLFVFIVTSQNYSSDKKRVSKEDASAWLSQGVNRLPKHIATMPFNSDYSVSFLTYEFEVPESNHRVQQSCPCQHQAVEHFSITGLKELLVK